MHALPVCDINPHRKTKSAINYEKIRCHDRLHLLRRSILEIPPLLRLPLQGDGRSEAVRAASQAVSPYNCIDRISAEFRWQGRFTLTDAVKEP